MLKLKKSESESESEITKTVKNNPDADVKPLVSSVKNILSQQ